MTKSNARPTLDWDYNDDGKRAELRYRGERVVGKHARQLNAILVSFSDDGVELPTLAAARVLRNELLDELDLVETELRAHDGLLMRRRELRGLLALK